MKSAKQLFSGGIADKGPSIMRIKEHLIQPLQTEGGKISARRGGGKSVPRGSSSRNRDN